MVDSTRRYDPHRRRLLLSEALAGQPRLRGRLPAGPDRGGRDLDRPGRDRRRARRPTRRLLKVSLANYLAAAMLMPYAAFQRRAPRTGYDIELLARALRRQLRAGLPPAHHPVAARRARRALLPDAGRHRRQHLQALRRRGLPASRASAAPARAGTCTPPSGRRGRIITQIIETRDGARYFTLSRTVRRGRRPRGRARGRELAIGLGLRAEARPPAGLRPGLDLADPAVTAIGPACRLCDRPACPERAAPPVDRTLMMDEWRRSVSPFPSPPTGERRGRRSRCRRGCFSRSGVGRRLPPRDPASRRRFREGPASRCRRPGSPPARTGPRIRRTRRKAARGPG